MCRYDSAVLRPESLPAQLLELLLALLTNSLLVPELQSHHKPGPGVTRHGKSRYTIPVITLLGTLLPASVLSSEELSAEELSAEEIGPILILAPAQTNQAPFEIGDTAAGEFTGFREVLEKERLQQLSRIHI